MAFIKSGLFISLDGVIEAPETWHFPYFNDEMGAAVGQLMGESDATLLGRNTYEAFASYRPQADPADEMTATTNGARKYVVSNTLSEATWENSSVINGDVYASLAALKEDTGLSTTGSATLVRSLLEQGLVDELHLLVHPIVVGHGKKLFADGQTVPLELKSATTFQTGGAPDLHARQHRLTDRPDTVATVATSRHPEERPCATWWCTTRPRTWKTGSCRRRRRRPPSRSTCGRQLCPASCSAAKGCFQAQPVPVSKSPTGRSGSSTAPSPKPRS